VRKDEIPLLVEDFFAIHQCEESRRHSYLQAELFIVDLDRGIRKSKGLFKSYGYLPSP